jgi:hypothetical protein
MAQLLGCDQYSVKQLLNLRVTSFGFVEDLADEVDKSLDLVDASGFLALDHDGHADYPVSCCNVE